MKYLCLIWASMFRRRVRTIFTLLSIVAAFLLFGLLDSVRVTFAEAGQSAHGVDRLYTTPKVGGLNLPFNEKVSKGDSILYEIQFDEIDLNPVFVSGIFENKLS